MKRLIAVGMAFCLAAVPVNCFAEDEPDFSYLEDMSVKELKALDAAIHEILGDSGTSSSDGGEVTEEVFDNSKIAYEKLIEASEIGLQALSDIYGAWYYGIYNTENISENGWNDFCYELSVPASDIEKGIKENDIMYEVTITEHPSFDTIEKYFSFLSFANNFWQYCVNYVVYAYEDTENGFGTIEQDLNDAKDALKIVGQEYSDYKYYPNLKDFYSEVNSLYEFVSSPTGSFETLQTTKTDFENSIRKYTADLSFVFED